MFASPAILAIAIAILAGVAFGGGWMISDWRSGAQMAKLSSQNAVLTAANGKCATDVADVRGAMDAMTKASRELESKAAESMRQATSQVEQRTRTITKIKTLPQVALDMQCEAMKMEQLEYVQDRHK